MDSSKVPLEQVTKRENDSTAKFFKRLSSIKVEYEKEKRRTLQKFQSKYSDSEEVSFLKPKEEIVGLLRETLLDENLFELYQDVLLLLFPTQGDKEDNKAKRLLEFLEKVFAFDSATQKNLLEAAKYCTVQDTARVLHVQIVEAKDLPAKDVNGLSDPFCTLYLTTKEQSKRTKVVCETLDPTWNETFKFPVQSLSKDFLEISVWDHDPEERIRDKLGRLAGVRPGTIKTWVSDLSHGRSPKQEFMGKVKIPLKEISTETVEKWYSLKNNEKKGEVYVVTGLGIEKKRSIAVQQYRRMLQLLIIHELKVAPAAVAFVWEHSFKEPWAEYVLRQLRTGWGLSSKDVLLAKWQAYVKIHAVFPLSGRMFPILANDVFEKVSKSKYDTEEVIIWGKLYGKEFQGRYYEEGLIKKVYGYYGCAKVVIVWSATEELVRFFTFYVENLHVFFPCMHTASQLYYILRTLKLLLRPVDGIVNVQHTSRTYVNEAYILTELKRAIRKSALKSFKRLARMTLSGTDTLEVPHETSDDYFKDVERRISEYVNFCTLLNEDLIKGGQMAQNDFKLILGIDYHIITYNAYDEELSKLVKPAIGEFCSVLKSTCQSGKGKYYRSISDSSGDSSCNQPDIATPFFKFYIALKQFAVQAPASRSSYGWRVAGSLFQWMYPAVTHLLEIFAMIWKGWMEKAVKKDYTEEVPTIQREVLEYDGYQISSCAVDATHIISQINRFWTNLSWPVGEESSVSIVESIIQEVSHYSISFGELVATVSRSSEEVERSGMMGEQFCRSINNIVYVGRHTSDIIKQLALHQDSEEDDERKNKLRGFIEKQVEIQASGLQCIVQGMFRSVGGKIRPKVLEYLKGICDGYGSGGEVGNEERSVRGHSRVRDDKLVHDLLDFVGENLGMICRALVDEHFDDAILMIWEETLSSAKTIVAVGLKDHKPCLYFGKLKAVLMHVKSSLKSSLLGNLSSESSFSSSSTIRVLDGCVKSTSEFLKSLDIYGASSGELKLRYFGERHETQKVASGDLGMIALQVYYDSVGESLMVELLNARKLVPNESSGSRHPYCALQLVPSEVFPGGGTRAKTNVVKETLFPLFDQTFKFSIKRSVVESNGSGYLRLSVYDQDSRYFGKDDFVGEVYVFLKDVPISQGPRRIGDYPQSLLALTKPTTEHIRLLNSLLAHRSWDKDVGRFMKNEAEKSCG